MPRIPRPATAALVACALALPLPTVAQREASGLTYTQPLAPEAVMRVQDRLRERGAYAGRIDGVWGPDSQQALERFQQGRGLQVTGQLNQATALTLGLDPAGLLAGRSGGGAAGSGADAAPAAALSATPEPATIRAVQRRLGALGFYRAGVDGIWGPATQRALERFQEGRGLQPNGQLNPATVQALEIGGAEGGGAR